MAGQEPLSGVIKSYNGAKGYGFISCEAIEGDSFFSRNDLPSDAREVDGKFLEGRSVSFVPSAQPDGRNKASSLEISSDGELIPGVIKSYSEKNGYGFITSSCFPEGDVRFNRQEFKSAMMPGAAMQGQLVLFVPQALTDGKVRATSVIYQSGKNAQFMKGAAAPMMFSSPMASSYGAQSWAPSAAQSWGAGAGWGAKGGGKWGAAEGGGKWGAGNGSMMGASPGKGGGGSGKGGVMSGVVKSFSDRNMYGFITVPGQPDIKFGKADLVGSETIASGTSVQFQAVVGANGRMQAQQVKASGSGGMKRPMTAVTNGPSQKGSWGEPPQKRQKGSISTETTNQWVDGYVKSYNATKGFGFITSDNLSEDVFFMRSDLPTEGQAVAVGTAVGFELMTASNGKLRAQSISM